jgi:hypothetical protein
MAIVAAIKEGKLYITADLDGTAVSDRGNVVLASSHGFTQYEDIQFNLNVIKKKK